MRRFFIIMIAALGVAAPAAQAQNFFAPADNDRINAATKQALAEPLDDLTSDVAHLHPVAMFFLAKRMFDAGRRDDALFWFYEGQLRWKARIFQDKDNFEADMFERLFSDIGPDINTYAAHNVPLWTSTIDKVLDWDTNHPDDFTPAGEAKTKSRNGLAAFKLYIVAHQDEIAAKRAEADKQDVAQGSADDPYSGSGGAMFGTPQEMVPQYDPKLFVPFKPGVTVKKDVVAALGKPELWFTDKDGTSTLSYPYHTAVLPMLGMTRRLSVQFKFDANKILTAIDLPKDTGP